MLFSDLLGDAEPIYKALHRLRFTRGTTSSSSTSSTRPRPSSPFTGMLELEDNETSERMEVDADAIKADYLEEVASFRAGYKKECHGARIDLRSTSHGHAIRQGPDGLSSQPRVEAVDRNGFKNEKLSLRILETLKGLGWIMDISLLHAGLAAGATLAAIPVILHLFMRQTPKHVIFPALRLIRERHKRSKKQLKVKNWLLLAGENALARPHGPGPGPTDA